MLKSTKWLITSDNGQKIKPKHLKNKHNSNVLACSAIIALLLMSNLLEYIQCGSVLLYMY